MYGLKPVPFTEFSAACEARTLHRVAFSAVGSLRSQMI
jgi:hypothetical protein